MAHITFGQKDTDIKRHEQWRTAARGMGIRPDLDFKVQLFDYGTQLAVAASGWFLTEDVSTVRWPADWWEAVKERFFPSRWLKRWPVRYHTVDIKAIYPKLKIPEEAILKVRGRTIGAVV